MDFTTVLRRVGRPSSSTALGAIGLEFALDRMCAVQLAATDGELALRTTASVAYPDSREAAFADLPSLVEPLRRLRKTAGFGGRRVVTALPAPEMQILQIQYPTTREGSESRVILDLVGDRLPDPLTEYVMDYIPVRHDNRDGQQLALVAVSRRSTVLQLLSVLNKAGYQPHAIEIGPVAIRRLVAALNTGESIENVLVVNAGERKTFLTMISGRRLLMDQEVSVGQQQILATAQEELALSETEALETIHRWGLAEGTGHDAETRDQIQTLRLVLAPGFRSVADAIDQAFGYAASVTRGAPARRIFLSGSIARWRGAAAFLAGMTDANVELFPTPFANNKAQEPGEMTVASGLALRGLVDDA